VHTGVTEVMAGFACGSGHFLLAAARQLAAEISRLDAGLDTPSEALRQHALRDIVQHCIYGVDKNPLAVELCKTALWIETVEPGKPLSFLDAHIRCGDSLVGILDPTIMADGIPDEAYKPLTGDEKTVATAFRRRNQQAGQSVQGNLFDPEGLKPIAVMSLDLDTMPEDTLEQIDAKRKAWQQSLENQAMKQEELKADLFVGAFFAPKIQENAEKVPLTEDLNRLAKLLPLRPGLGEAIRALAKHYGFFHWSLAFPEVFARGGFDVVLGNPPWERIKLQEQEFFAPRSPEIANAPNKAARDRLIKALARQDATPAEQALHRDFEGAKHVAEAASQLIRTGGRYPLTGCGDVNTYAIFAETFMRLLSPIGRAGLIVPTGIATDDTTKRFFEDITQSDRLRSLLSFYEIRRWFPGTDDRRPFCLLTLGTGDEAAVFEFDISSIEDILCTEKRFSLSPKDILLVNPNTKTCPVFQSNADAELIKKIYARVPVLIDETKRSAGNPWGIRFMTMFHMSNDSGLFRTRMQLEEKGAQRNGVPWIDTDGETWVPLYEAKMIHQFDHRYGTFEGLSIRPQNAPLVRPKTSQLCDKKYELEPWYWVSQVEVEERLRAKGWIHGWLMGWRDTGRSTDERTVIATVFPRRAVSNKLPLILPSAECNPALVGCLLANFSTLSFDFVARAKIGGTTINFFYVKQFPILAPASYTEEGIDFIIPRVLELNFTSEHMQSFAEYLGYNGSPFTWDPDCRALLRSELDAYYAYLYGLTRDELRYILDPADIMGPNYPSETFRVLKENELAQFREYRTQRLVLQAWDRLQMDGLLNSRPSSVRPY
jgi:Eco57I restriction-modification methylase